MRAMRSPRGPRSPWLLGSMWYVPLSVTAVMSSGANHPSSTFSQPFTWCAVVPPPIIENWSPYSRLRHAPLSGTSPTPSGPVHTNALACSSPKLCPSSCAAAPSAYPCRSNVFPPSSPTPP